MSLMQKMIKQVKVERKCKPNGIVLTKEHINNLNNRIRKDVQQNEKEYLSGLIELESNPVIVK